MTNKPQTAPIIRDATLDDLARVVALLQQMSLDGPREDAGPPLPRASAAKITR